MSKKKQKEPTLQERLEQAIGKHTGTAQAIDCANEQLNQMKTELLRTEGEIRLLQNMVKESTQTE